MTAKLVFENLKHRPMRSLLSFLLIGVPVTLILTLVGLTHGMIEDSQQRQRGSGADIVVRGTNAAAAINFSGATLSDKFIPFLQEQPHVEVAVGVLNHNIQLPLTITGIDLDRFTAMSGGFTYLEGGPFQDAGGGGGDRRHSAERHLHAGDTIMQLNRPWHVCGVVEGGKLSHIFVQLKVLQELDSSTGKVSQIFLKLDYPANTTAVIQALKEKMPEYPIISMEELTSMLNVFQRIHSGHRRHGGDAAWRGRHRSRHRAELRGEMADPRVRPGVHSDGHRAGLVAPRVGYHPGQRHAGRPLPGIARGAS